MRQGYVSVKSVYVVTEDSALLKTCEEALRSWDVELIATSRHNALEPGLWVWDCRNAQQPPPSSREELTNCICLVDRKGLLCFPEDILLFAAAVVLLPVDTVHLNIAFEQALARQHSTTTLRNKDEKDALLQCFLQANLKLQQHDQERTTFLNRALHDFRAPLTSITGYCGLLLGGHAGSLDPEQTESIRRIQNSAKRLSRHVEGMFQLGVRRVKQIQPQLIRGDITEAVEIAVSEVDAFVQPKEITTNIEMDEPDGDLLFEPEKITQLTINLLENACRFSPKRGVIQIKGYSHFWERRSRAYRDQFGDSDRRARRDTRPNCYRIDISDCGIGIAPDHLTSIFEEYTSYAGGRDRSGTGLGLAISRDIVESHRGRIWAEPRTAGATFSFVLPYAVEQALQHDLSIAVSATV
jgi:signal transduction histidine kinase